jgi:hypothetical protein
MERGITLRYSKSMLAIMLVAFGIATLALYAHYTGVNMPFGARVFQSSFQHYGMLTVAAFSGLKVLYDLFFRILDASRKIVVNEHGITDQYSLRRNGFIPWDEIAGVDIKGGKWGIGIMHIYLNRPRHGSETIKLGELAMDQFLTRRLEATHEKITYNHRIGAFG